MTRAELKIGDWVSYEGKPFQIYDMTRQGDVVWYDEGASSVLMEEIEPIPLTEEILEKNGWKEEAANDWWNKEIPILNMYYSNSSDMYVVYFALHYQADKDKIAEIHTIRYVHQLQHLLWALRLDDDLKL